ncbi:carboxypeptidase regulatory-like domain-containing protein [Acidicapsa dinghuensis]|uniref:Carboxypeptidase regulatory-like domain-containing protein n=1 Tax=Acidicapsa dinghuensis TaxID=2218256 RepID=A0ABW1ELK7_9BACT|nr:TonB-dependent receptor [Acidicapsa dinghuensis]
MARFCGRYFRNILVFLCVLAVAGVCAMAQSGTNSGTIAGTVTDSSGALVPGATVTIRNPVSGYERTAKTDNQGQYRFANLPFNPYHIEIKAQGFNGYHHDVNVNSPVVINETDALQIGTAATTVTVDSGDLVENDSTVHTDVDRGLMEKIPLESQSSGLSSLVTETSPGVSSDSNGQIHGLGDHASNTFSIDGQDISDQQSKVFSNQLPQNSVQSVEVISGAPPAEFGGKTSLIIQVTTRSGMGVTKPTGSVTTSFGSFGTASGGIDLSYGGNKWGNFIEVDGLNTGRFLDPPEFKVFHAKGNEQNVFERVDRSFTQNDSVHVDFNYSRSWFQTPNTYDNLNVQNVLSGGATPDPVLGSVGDADQRSQIGTFNIAPTYTRVINTASVLNFGAFVRRDAYNYYPSNNPLADRGPANLQTSSISQYRTLTNSGAHADLSYSKGIHNAKFGAMYAQTFLNENDTLGIVDPLYNAPCVDANGNAVAGYASPDNCGDNFANSNYLAVLGPYDLTRGGGLFAFDGHSDVKELALYAQDQITLGNWLFNLGLREDVYNGLTTANQTEPRLGLSYKIKPTNTVLRLSYARTLETPFNENLVLSSTGCENAVLSPLLACSGNSLGTLRPGFKNEFHAGFQQAFGKNLVVSGDYIWKYTHNAFDFSVLGNTPITFPIDWHNSKIPGLVLRADVPNWRGISGYVVMSSVAARFFPPQVGGAGATVGQTGLPFRIDHDERYNETTHVQYQAPWKWGNFMTPWVSLNWRYDSGMVAGSAPCYNLLSNDPNSACGDTSTTLDGQPAVDLSHLTADEEFQAGMVCNGQRATPGNPLPAVCPASEYSSTLIHIPAPGTGDNDKAPPRVDGRSLIDASVGQDNLFHGDRYKWSLHLSAVNITNKYALYNFLSTFSGTHYVTPRALTAELGFHF